SSRAPNSRAQRAKNGCAASGAHQSDTGPVRARTAVERAWRTRPACRLAAASAPSTPASRVFTAPGTGAFANTAIAASGGGAVDVIAAGEAVRIGAQRVREAQAPHQHHGGERA